MTDSQSLHLLFFPVVFSAFSTLLCPTLAASGTDNDYPAHPRFVCTPIPVDADPACLPAVSPGVGVPEPRGPGKHNAPPAGWWGASEEAKATILHLRESLVQQRETILDQRETIRELTAKLTLCEGPGQGAAPHDQHHGTVSPLHHPALGSHHTDTDKWHHGNQQSHHENQNLKPDSPHSLSAWGQHSDGGHSSNNQGKDKHVTPGDTSSSPEQMERLLQVLKERLDNLQKRNTSIAYSTSLKDLLQRKISTLEQQLHHSTAALNGHDRHDDDSGHDHHDDDSSHDHHDDDSGHDHHDDDSGHDHHDDDSSHDHHDDDSGHDHHDEDTSHRDDGEHHKADDGHPSDHNDDHSHSGHSETDHHEDSHKDDHHDPDDRHDDHGNGHHEDIDGHHSNEADSHSYFPLTGYRAAGPHADSHSNKLDTLLNQLNLAGSRRKSKSPDAFQISFPMRTNYMYGRVKRTLLQEIFALTLCLWIKAGVGPGMGTPFSYSAPGQANELVLIEWGNNPMELLIDDKAVTLPLSLGDGKWHHVCVTWSTRDGQWQAYQDGVQRGSGINISPWHPIKPGGVFILGQEQDTLGGRFDASQSFVGEISELHMWSHVLTASDIYSLVSCGSHLRGDVIAWSNTEVELHGGVSSYPFDPCH